jgi:hypothetical protein
MDARFFNEHTGAACGLVIGIILGSMAVDLGWLNMRFPPMAPELDQPAPHAAVAAASASSQR